MQIPKIKILENIFLLEDGRKTETCSSISSKINL
jgi:hypothetical protein